ncbi:hypothetical protein BW730_00795 [Tessaracoccus aquimaris]|uniref:MobA-like NTP transferase domain-containing protein n=1 Tax=Tessaracoccus aquimaris TaxID=1332264 RepID=A0A1Q2CJN5_9ACTN|nr:hypothetical protein BW730_00795 [Tessaracoccus aquimaris]
MGSAAGRRPFLADGHRQASAARRRHVARRSRGRRAAHGRRPGHRLVPERPDVARDGVSFVLEDPPFGGPVAGIAAALGAIDADDGEVYLLAGDLVAPAEIVDLLRAHDLDGDGVALIDREGWPQYLAGRYRLAALRRVLAGESRDRSVRRTFRVLDLILIPAEKDVTGDVDTPEQAETAGLRFPEPAADQA